MSLPLTLDTSAQPSFASADPAPAQRALESLWGQGGGEPRAFLRLPQDDATAGRIADWAVRAPEVDDIVLVGVGGSALSAPIMAALAPRDSAERPALHVLDEVDPAFVEDRLATIDPSRAMLLVISKSGSTLEPRAIFGLFEAHFHARLGARAQDRIAVITEAADNPLRTIAESRGYTTFELPSAVGGRYSALTSVGLVPAALLGVAPDRLLAGAREILPALQSPDLATNPALALAHAHMAAYGSGRERALLWCYGERLVPVGAWWVQLVAESLGKQGASGPEGCAPAWARGPADQHSLLQRLLDGPDDTLTTFLSTPTTGTGAQVPSGSGPASDVPLGSLLEIQRKATQDAIDSRKRPYLDMRLRDHSPETVAALLVTWQLAVAVWGVARGIDPFDQPGVALGKEATLRRLDDLRT